MFDPAHDCCTGKGLRHYMDCIEDIHREAHALTPVELPLSSCIGQSLATDVRAPISLPSFDNSAMDGFAFKADTVAAADTDHPVYLPVIGASIAGDTAEQPAVPSGYAVKIMTGAPMPEGTDTVLPVEAASWESEQLKFHAPYPKGRHVRLIGQDVAEGNLVLKSGIPVSCQHLPLLSALGLSRLLVRPKPTVAWISTGQEICDDFDKPLPSGHIYNATRLFGEAMAQDMGFDLQSAITVRDTAEDFAAALKEAQSASPQIILSTGGVSAGQYDFVKPVIEDMSATIIFHKARIKPAKPALFARLPNGSYFFGLPGNPISTALALRAFVYPFVRALSGQKPEPMRVARLTADVRADSGKTVFLMGKVRSSDSGLLLATPNTRQQSFQTAPFAESNSWLLVPEGISELSAGDQIHCLPFSPTGL
ncbi:MAG: molybdopterin molybdotransferase MoeA [Alphaproteobacteria bacterium]|nr:molybdopterin molybdotransferase MoeA [Alphaproteobacteria bacterium]